MLYKGKATCEKHGEFEWQLAESVKNTVIVRKNFVTINVKDYSKETKTLIARCPRCGFGIKVTDYRQHRTNLLQIGEK